MRFAIAFNVFFAALFAGMVAAKVVPVAREVAIRAEPTIQACVTSNPTNCGADSQCFPASSKAVIPELGVCGPVNALAPPKEAAILGILCATAADCGTAGFVCVDSFAAITGFLGTLPLVSGLVTTVLGLLETLLGGGLLGGLGIPLFTGVCLPEL